MSGWISALAAMLAVDDRALVVTVANAAGSTPREAGAAMVVGRSSVAGTIGGGHLEFEAIRMARDALDNGELPASWVLRFPLAARLGQCCGGVATLAFAAYDGRAMAWLERTSLWQRSATPFVHVQRIGSSAATSLLVTRDDAFGTTGDSLLDRTAIDLARASLGAALPGTTLLSANDATLLVQRVAPDDFTVMIFGNGHVGRALVDVLGVTAATVRWIDSRENAFPPQLPANATAIPTDAPEDELRLAPPGAYVVVMTHSHALDFDLMTVALTRDDWRYLGLIGSRSKRNQFEKRLSARGFGNDVLARVICPIGAGGMRLASKHPGTIAIAVAAELLALHEAATVLQREPSRIGAARSTRR